MKTLFTITILFIASQVINLQDIVGKYVIQDDGSFSSIELKRNKSFKYEHRGPSCWVWHDKIGKWHTEGKTLILIDSFEWKEETVIMNESLIKPENGLIEIQFSDANNNPIENLEVKYDYINRSEFRQKGTTNKNGIVVFKSMKAKYNPSKDEARLSFTYKEFEDEVSIDIFPKLMNNKITFRINSTPQIEKRERIEKYKIEGNELIGLEGNSLDPGKKFIKNKW